MQRFHRFAGVWLLIVVTAGCQTDIAANSVPAKLQAERSGKLFRLTQRLSLSLRHGYSVNDLKANTHWREVGTIAEGNVLKAVDTVLMVNTGDKSEAYLVVKGTQAAGVYLPAESVFVNADTVVNISLAEETQ